MRPKRPRRPKPKIVRPKQPRQLNTNKRQQLEAMRKKIKSRQAAINQRKQHRKATLPTAKPSSTIKEDVQQQLSSLQFNLDNLQDDITLVSIHDDMGKVEGMLATLAIDLDALRNQGYVFKNYLEKKIDVLTDKWEDLNENIADDIEKQSDKLDKESDEAEKLLRRALNGNKTLVAQAESAIDSLERKVGAVRQSLSSTYNNVAKTIKQTRYELDKVKWAFEQANEAKFDFLEGEYLIGACKVELLDDPNDKDGPDGIFYLTDERILFERKEKVSTKKFLFITTESEMVQEVEFEVPLEWIEEVEAQDKRKFLSTKELIILQLSHEAPSRNVIFRLDGEKNENWSQYINRARSNDIDRERIAEAMAEKEEAAQEIAEAPTSCATCGAPFSGSISRGQNQIECEYCGSITRF